MGHRFPWFVRAMAKVAWMVVNHYHLKDPKSGLWMVGAMCQAVFDGA